LLNWASGEARREKGRGGERERGRKGEGEKGRRGERERGRRRAGETGDSGLKTGDGSQNRER